MSRTKLDLDASESAHHRTNRRTEDLTAYKIRDKCDNINFLVLQSLQNS